MHILKILIVAMDESHSLTLIIQYRGRYTEFQDSFFPPATNKLGGEENAYPMILVCC